MKTTTRVIASLAALVLAGGLSACAGSDQTTASSAAPTTVNTSAPLYAQLPQSVKDKGSIQVGSDIAYAPMEYYDTDGKTVLGFDKELGDLLATELGVPLVFNNATFDGLITQLDSNRFDLAISSMSDTVERQQKVDFVDYYISGSIDHRAERGGRRALAVPSSHPRHGGARHHSTGLRRGRNHREDG